MAEVAASPQHSPEASTSAPPPPADGPANDATTTNDDAEMTDAPPADSSEESAAAELPEGASEVLYINNLNEKIKLPGSSSLSPSCDT
jgi:U2 small nuclear ribonucleoprotein B''